MSLALSIVVIVVLSLSVIAAFVMFGWAALQDGRAETSDAPPTRLRFRRRDRPSRPAR